MLIRYVSLVRERIHALIRFVLIAEDSEGPSLRRNYGEQRANRGADCRLLCIHRTCKGRCVVRIWSLSWTELFAIQQSREPTNSRRWFDPACEVPRCYRNFKPESEEVKLKNKAHVSFGNEATSSCHRQLLRR